MKVPLKVNAILLIPFSEYHPVNSIVNEPRTSTRELCSESIVKEGLFDEEPLW